MYMQKLIFWR